MDKAPIIPTLKKVVPMAFALGAVMELFMIYGKVGKETFYETACRLEIERRERREEAYNVLRERVEKRKAERLQNAKGDEDTT